MNDPLDTIDIDVSSRQAVGPASTGEDRSGVDREPAALSRSTIEQNQGEALDVAYYNPRSPQYHIASERPEHRNILLLKMQGHTNVEIAELTGYTNVHVATVVKQPWAQDFMSRHQSNLGLRKVETLLDGAIGKAVERLILEIDNTKPGANAMSRISAADKLLDRRFGKAAQPILHSKITDPAKQSDAEIQARLDELRRLQSVEIVN